MILILLCILLCEVTKPWLMCGYYGYKNHVFFCFIRVKTMANFRKGTWKLGENISCVGGGEIIIDIKTKHVINLNTHKSFAGL